MTSSLSYWWVAPSAVVTVDKLEESHRTTLTNYLRLTGIEIGLLINFNAEKLRDGIKRLIVSSTKPPLRYTTD